MKFFIRTIILLVVPFQYSGASEMGAPVDLIDGLFTPEFVIQGIEFVIQGISGLCILYLTFCKSYFTEKGKNVATKEDIKWITQEVETVKNSLLLSTQAKLSLHNEERESLIKSWEKMDHWYSIVDNMSLPIEFDDNGDVEKATRQLENGRIECSAAFARVELFNSNTELADSYRELFSAVCNLGFRVTKALIDNKALQAKEKGWSYSYTKEHLALYEDLQKDRFDAHQNIFKLKREFRSSVQKHLKELANNST